MIIYKENINRSSKLSKKKKLDKKRFDALCINYDNCSFEDYAKCNIEDYDKTIRHLGYNEKLGDLWNNYKKEKKKIERDEINSRLKKMKGKI